MWNVGKRLTLGFLLVIIFDLKSSNQQCLSRNDAKQPNRNGRQEFYTGQQEFSLALLKAVNQLMPNENIFFSPYSTFHALSIAYFLSGGETEKYLKNILKFSATQEKIDIYNAFKFDKILTDHNSLNKSYEFSNANKIYVSDQIETRNCVKELFPYELEPTAFNTNPENARDNINKWVENQTHNIIKDLLPPGTIDAETSLVLVNAAYFKGMWQNKFDPELTKPEVFYVSPSKQIMVDMMNVEATFNHDVSETLGAHILELPYQGNDISMFILLPPFAKVGAIDETLKKLNADQLKQIVESKHLLPKTVQVYLPKFSLERTLELVPILEKLGVGDLFKKSANFEALTTSNNSVSLGNCLHKAKIEVNEEGTKAAAATVAFSFRSSRPLEPTIFKCDHPFVYIIYDRIQEAILFTGIFKTPHN